MRTLTLKTRSGKIMRRILRKIAENEFGSLGDTSTLADPSVVDDLIDKRKVGQPRLGGAHHHWCAVLTAATAH